MAGITGQGDTFDLPNYTGELFSVTPQDTPLLSAIGGLTGGEAVNSTVFSWQYYDLRDAADDRQRLEGANAPTAEARVRATARNVLEIHQEALEVSYTKQAATGQIASNGSSHPHAEAGAGSNPVTDEVDWQLRQHLIQIARDVEVTFITGEFQEPANNSTARKTRGLVEAIATNAIDAGGASINDEGEELVEDALQAAYDNGGLMDGETRTIMLGSTQKRLLTKRFVTDAGYQEGSRNVGGVNVQTIETDFGTLNVMLNRHVPDDTILILSLEELAPKFLEIPGKGHFFVEPLSKVGAADKYQIYGEIGLKYGNERKHAVITDLGDGQGS